MTPEELDKARWLRADRTHPSNYACAGIEAARARRRKALRKLTQLTEEYGGYEELKGTNEEDAR